MDRLFDLAFVRPPPSSYVNCVSANPDRSNIDLSLARRQHQQYVSTLRESGIIVVELSPLEQFPDSVFMQDPALVGRSVIVVGRFGEERRRGEESVFAEDVANSNTRVGEMCYVSSPGTLEGGDIVVTENGLFVGESARTNTTGIQQLSACLYGLPVKPVKTNLMHLLCGCSYLTDREMIIAPELINVEAFSGIRFVTVPKEEAYACDCLYVGERRVIIPSGFPKAAANLKRAGYRPIEVDMSEFYKGDGGVTCLSSPVYKLF